MGYKFANAQLLGINYRVSLFGALCTSCLDLAFGPSEAVQSTNMKKCVAALCLLSALVDANETILGAYIFHRHGDRTPKALAPTNLTALGYSQVYTSGQYYRQRYLTGPARIHGLSQDIVKLSQISVTAPVDNVLQNSAMGFLQGLYPPVGNQMSTEALANGSNIQSPMEGYQLIPINTIETNAGSEDSGWLQDATLCVNAKVSSNAYFSSPAYELLFSSTREFYSSLVSVVNQTLDEEDTTYKNAYIVYDLINVAEIHNTTISASDVLSDSALFQLRTLADAHEWGLAYNASDNTRAISGMQLAGEILEALNKTIQSGQQGSNANKVGVQFGAYATFLSFFGLTDLFQVDDDFMGVPDYASSMDFELFTTSDVSSGFPSPDDIMVRFMFQNGTASNSNEPTVYPLFGGNSEALSWKTFSESLGKFAVHTTEQWCQVCGNTDGNCAQYASGSDNVPNKNGNTGVSRMSAAVGGVIGACVTLAVVLGALAAFLLLGGFRIIRKRAAVSTPSASEAAVTKV
jgi:hypothetical protein